MKKIILEFEVENNYNLYEVRIAQDAQRLGLVVHKLDEFLRKKIKYEDLPEEVTKELWEVRDYLTNELKDAHLDYIWEE